MIDNETKTAYFFVIRNGKEFLVQNMNGETSVSPKSLEWTNTARQTRRNFYRELKAHCTFHESPNRKRLITTENLWGMPKFRTWHEIPGWLTWDK